MCTHAFTLIEAYLLCCRFAVVGRWLSMILPFTQIHGIHCGLPDLLNQMIG